jgi:3-phosphoshikimate 1-carboxyvinyltransferase
VANAIGNQVTMENLPSESAQGDQKIVEIANEMCYNKRTGKPACFDIDATDIPDLVPILAVLATFGDAPSRITGAHRLKIKESDRLAAISDLLCRLGGQVTANDDGLEIQPVASLHGGVVDSYGDHRIAMCAAIAATRCTQPVTILHGECVEKSYPQFYEDYNQLGGSAHVIVLE